jgi:cytoskeletal protein RodZ
MLYAHICTIMFNFIHNKLCKFRTEKVNEANAQKKAFSKTTGVLTAKPSKFILIFVCLFLVVIFCLLFALVYIYRLKLKSRQPVLPIALNSISSAQNSASVSTQTSSVSAQTGSNIQNAVAVRSVSQYGVAPASSALVPVPIPTVPHRNADAEVRSVLGPSLNSFYDLGSDIPIIDL